MPIYKKIPKDVKEIGAVAIGRYAIFVPGIIKAAAVHDKLQKADRSKKGIPAVGYITIKRVKTFYCRYGFVNDPDIYE